MYKWLLYPDDEVKKYSHTIYQVFKFVAFAALFYMVVSLPRC